MTHRAPLAVAACVLAAAVLTEPHAAAAQPPRAVPRQVALARPSVVVRPTVFVGGYYYPPLYRASLYYGSPYYLSYPYYGSRYAGAISFGSRSWGASYYYQAPPPYYGRYDLSGSLRLQVTPKDTEVFVDGYYAGTVDDFDGMFQRLHIEPGDHEVELYLAGHRPHQQRIFLQPDKTFSIRHVMEPLGAGEPEPARPAGAPLPRQPRDPASAPPAPPQSQVNPAAPGAAGFGQLSLRVQPADAEIVIDGETWTGALENERLTVELGAGVHRLEIRKAGHRSYFTDVTIRAGAVRTLNVALTKQ